MLHFNVTVTFFLIDVASTKCRSLHCELFGTDLSGSHFNDLLSSLELLPHSLTKIS